MSDQFIIEYLSSIKSSTKRRNIAIRNSIGDTGPEKHRYAINKLKYIISKTSNKRIKEAARKDIERFKRRAVIS